jgi:GntR family transcriptional repressor for pyruvate dehydrogenase complex
VADTARPQGRLADAKTSRQRALDVADSLRPLERPRLYEQLIDRLRQYVRDAGLRAGDALPSERLLAQRLGVSRNTLKQATLALEVQGIVEIRHGDGTYLRRDDVASEPLGELMARRERIPAVLEAREAIEVRLTGLAALRRSETDLKKMSAAIGQMRIAIAAGLDGGEGDHQFHATVVAAASSPVLAAFYSEIEKDIDETRAESLRQPGRPPQSLDQHVAIFEAIVAQDADAASAAALEHVRRAASVRLLDWQVSEGALQDG